MKKALCATALLLALPGLRAQERSTDTLVHLTGRPWLTLDPHNAYDAVSLILTGNVYEGLVTFADVEDPEALVPVLAAEVPTRENGLVSADGLTYAFPIRAGVRFHDGSPLTPEDVRYSLLRFLLSDTEGGPAALLLKPVLGVYGTRDASGHLALTFAEAAAAVSVNGDRVVVKLKRPDRSFLKALAALPIVVSKAWGAARKDWDGTEKTWRKLNNRPAEADPLHAAMNGTGPFRLEKADPERQEVLLARNEDYWRKPAALSRVLFKVVPGGGLRLFMLETGDADSSFLEPSYAGPARQTRGVRVLERPASGRLGEILFFNFDAAGKDNPQLGSGALDGKGVPAGFFADPDVREGFAYSFDYEDFLKDGLGGRGRRTAGVFPEAYGVTEGASRFAADPVKATAAFKRAFGGKLWERGFLVPAAYSQDNDTRQAAVAALRAGLARLNPRFQVRPLPLPSAEFYEELEARRLPLFAASFEPDYPDAQAFAFGLLHSRSYFPKFSGYADAEADALVEEAAGAEPARRREIYGRLQAIASRDVPHILTYAPPRYIVCRDWVEGCGSRDDANNLASAGLPYFYSLSKKSR